MLISVSDKPRKIAVKPTEFSIELVTHICERMANGETMAQICIPDEMPHPYTVRKWALSKINGFDVMYAHARELQMHAWVDGIMDIADAPPVMVTQQVAGQANVTETRIDPADAQHRRNQIDTRKWLASKVLPKIYGEPKSQISVVHTDARALSDSELAAIIHAASPQLTIDGHCEPVTDKTE
jgi:hypothetical protein